MLLVGGGPYADTLREIACEEGIAERVIFAGEQPWDSIGKYYALGDAFISASTSETQGLVYIEAMSAGLPVVAKIDPSISWLIDHKKTGILFDRREEISGALELAIYDPDTARTVTAGAIEVARQNSVATFGENVLACYEKAIESHGRRDALAQ